MAYIECNKVTELIRSYGINAVENKQATLDPVDDIVSLIKAVESIPTADVADVVYAKWEISSDGYYPYCSHCKTEPENGVMSKYCPECGAKMDKERNDT